MPGGSALSLGWVMVAPEGATACPAPSVPCALTPRPGVSPLCISLSLRSHPVYLLLLPPSPEVLWEALYFIKFCSPQNLILRLVRVRCPVDVC